MFSEEFSYQSVRPHLFDEKGICNIINVFNYVLSFGRAGKIYFVAWEIPKQGLDIDSVMLYGALHFLEEQGYIECITPKSKRDKIPIESWKYQILRSVVETK